MSTAVGRVLAVCVVHAEIELPATVSRVGRSGIDKRPRAGRIPVGRHGLDGDHCSDTENHGGIDQAVYAYAEEDAAGWGERLDRELPAGWFGENLRISGLAVSDAVIGERWVVGDSVLEVTAPRVPCATFQYHVGEQYWVKRFTQQADTGAYLRVVVEGSIGAGDSVFVDHRPPHGVTVRDLFTGADPERLRLLLDTEPTISADARMQIDRHARRRAGAAEARS